MRKIIPVPVIFILGIIICLVLVSVWRLFYTIPIERVLPKDPIFYMRLTDLERNWESFSQTDFWKKLSQIDPRRFLLATGIPDRELAQYDALIKNFSSPTATKVFRELFGRDAALAVYWPPETDFDQTSPRDIFSHVVFVTRLKPGRQVVELLIPILAAKSEDVSHSKIRYRNHDVHLITSRGGDLIVAYTRRADLLIFGVSQEMPRRCLDIVGDAAETLAHDKNYHRVRSGYLSGADLHFYANLASLASHMKKNVIELVAKKQGKDPEEISKLFGQRMDQMFGFQYLGLSGQHDSLYQAKAELYYDKEELNPRLFSIDSCDPIKNDSLAFIPESVLFYQWSACYDFDYYWQQAQAKMRQTDSLSEDKTTAAEAIVGLEKKINISIGDDILPLLGHEVGNAFYDVDLTGMFPVPQVLFFIEIKDTLAAERILKRLSQQIPLIRLETKDYRGSQIHHFAVPVLESLKPGYALINDYLVFSTQSVLLEKCLDSLAQPALRLSENPFFQDEDLGLQGKYNSIFFVNIALVAGQLQKVLEWGDDWLNQQEAKREAFRQGQVQVLTDLQTKIAEDEEKLDAMQEKLTSARPQKEEGLLLESQIRSIYASIREQEASQTATAQESQMAALLELRQRLKGLEEQRDRLDPPLVEIRRMEAEAKILRDQIKASREKSEEVQKIIAQFPQKPQISPEKRAFYIQEYIRPLLQALSECEMFAGPMIFQDGWIESHLYLKLH